MWSKYKHRDLSNAEAIQFNGFNFGFIYDWVNNCQGVYPACFYESIEILGEKINLNDWVIKNDNNTITVMNDLDFKEAF